MTEEEAKTKWCPMNRVIGLIDSDKPYEPPPVANCIGSSCMLWRWRSKENGDGYCGIGARPVGQLQ